MKQVLSGQFNHLVAFFLVFFSTLLAIQVYFDHRYDVVSSSRYVQKAEEADQLISALLEAQQEKVALAALYLSQHPTIKNAFTSKDTSQLNFGSYFKQNNNFDELKHLRVQLINKRGFSLYRNWTKKTGDRIVDNRKDLELFFKSPQIMHTLSVGIYNLTLKTIVPIYDNQKLLGAFEVIGSLDGLNAKLEKAGISPFLLVNKSYRPQLLSQSHQDYIGDAYIVTKQVNPSLVAAIKTNRISEVQTSTVYELCADINHYVSFKHLNDINGQPMATFFLFQDLISIKGEFSQPLVPALLSVSAIFLLLLLSYFGWLFYRNSQKTIAFNQSLQEEVEHSHQALHSQALFWQKVIDGLDDIVLVVYKNTRQFLMNQSAEKLYRLRQDNLCSKCTETQLTREGAVPFSSHPGVRESFDKKQVTTRVEGLVIDKQQRYFEFTATPVLDASGEVQQVVEVGHDITPYVEAKHQVELQKSKLDEIAYFDSLTGLPNRRLFLDRLEQAVISGQRYGSRLAVIFLDLDFFKTINDTYGHEYGDKVLVECSQVLSKAVRKSGTVSRLGGDEFTVIIEQIPHADVVADVVNNILESLSHPVKVEDHRFYLGASIGVSLFPSDGKNCYDLLKNADTAMYQAKGNGRNGYAFYNPAMTTKAIKRIELETQLRVAIEEHQFEAYFQPQFHISDHSITGFEALVRWNHPTEGVLLPFEFIKLAEETGLIIQIGRQVILQAMQAITEWHTKGLTEGRMAINISAKQFANEGLSKVIKSSLESTGCRAEWIEIELTETSVMQNRTYAAQVLSDLKEMGVSISIDDFGTGYSSLAQLKRMPIDRIKIDQSFIYDLPHDNEDAEITKTIINMATNLGLSTVAEGVENQSQSEFMEEFGCLNAQGFLFSRPLTKDRTGSLLMGRLPSNSIN